MKRRPDAQRRIMQAIRSKHTKPELLVRSLVHQMGYRYRLHRQDLPGKPDLVFGPRRMLIFVHGCFWHQHTGCREGRLPASNQEYWKRKLAKNVNRDAEHLTRLGADGWDTFVIWECETNNKSALRRRLKKFLRGR